MLSVKLNTHSIVLLVNGTSTYKNSWCHLYVPLLSSILPVSKGKSGEWKYRILFTVSGRDTVLYMCVYVCVCSGYS